MFTVRTMTALTSETVGSDCNTGGRRTNFFPGKKERIPPILLKSKTRYDDTTVFFLHRPINVFSVSLSITVRNFILEELSR